jgi:MoxR-like ATPase
MLQGLDQHLCTTSIFIAYSCGDAAEAATACPNGLAAARQIPQNAQLHDETLPQSIDETQTLLAAGITLPTVASRPRSFLALAMQRPLFLEGEAGVGKTEIAKVVAQALGRDLIRLQCYEGLDIAQAAYEWNYPRQMIEIRMAEAEGVKSREGLEQDIFSERFLVRRPLLRALQSAGARRCC